MHNMFDFIAKNGLGILYLFLILVGAIFLLNYLAWLFKWGRYCHDRVNDKGSVIYILTEMIVKIITDFRHFLALVLVIIFACSLIYACSISNGKVDDLSKALQAVVSTLGGLVGSIVGYYFGESAAKSRNATDNVSRDSTPIVQSEEIEPVEPPEMLR